MANDSPSIPGFQVYRKLGGGSFGNVWAAMWTRGASLCFVAIKVPNSATRADPALMKEFAEEGATLLDLHHPNIVQVYATGRGHGDIPFIAMELAGASLKQYVKNEGLLSRSGLDRCKMCQGIAAGMKYLEEKRLVHRDLAARNVLVAENGQCKIADFGMTRRMVQPNSGCASYYYDVNGYAYVAGNPEGAIPVLWSAPEVLSGRRCTSKSDVWSFGVLIWEVMSSGATPYEWPQQIPGFSAAAPSIRTLQTYLAIGVRLLKPTGCRDNVYALMKDAWAYEPAWRPSFSTILERLQGIIRGWYQQPSALALSLQPRVPMIRGSALAYPKLVGSTVNRYRPY
eukprot:scpid21502/ scgid10172/ Tyrosine-protein kinase isoform SRK4